MDAFLRAYAAQQAKEAEMRDANYDAGEVLEYLSCTAVQVNDVYVSKTEHTYCNFLKLIIIMSIEVPIIVSCDI